MRLFSARGLAWRRQDGESVRVGERERIQQPHDARDDAGIAIDFARRAKCCDGIFGRDAPAGRLYGFTHRQPAQRDALGVQRIVQFRRLREQFVRVFDGGGEGVDGIP